MTVDRSVFKPRLARHIAFLLTSLTLIALPIAGCSATTGSNDTGGAAGTVARPLLSGEPVWGKTPAYLYGVNDGVNWDPQHNMDVGAEGASIQAKLKAAQVPIARVWFFQYSLVDNHPLSDAEQLQKLHAVQAAGMTCFANFPTENTADYDLHLLGLLRGACRYVEIMNEPDLEQAAWNGGQTVNSTAYLKFWNQFIPQARKSYPGILFGGPADYNNQGNECTYTPSGSTCFLQKVLIGMAKSGVLPDFVTYHWYPCWNNTADQCLALASQFDQAAAQVVGWARQYFPGKHIPVICSEWNADPGNPSYMSDQTWMAKFVTAALGSIQKSDLAGAMEFDISSYGNWGTDDLFEIYNGGKPKAQFNALADAIAAAKGSKG